ncbi:MAG: NUDIX hydrolase [Gammaproteobacteria bacterium]|nr:NUDIX hydrolase [Gammaproteobacteria bacterium]
MSRPVTPLLAADIIIRLRGMSKYSVVLIERLNPPYGWALPGGFVDVGESLESAAVREAKEETCLDVSLQALLGCYSDPSRDARGHTVSAVYMATASGKPTAADDAKQIMVMDSRDTATRLAFDHRQILDDYIALLKTGRIAPLR